MQDKQAQDFKDTWTTKVVNTNAVNKLSLSQLKKVAKILEKVK